MRGITPTIFEARRAFYSGHVEMQDEVVNQQNCILRTDLLLATKKENLTLPQQW